MPNLSNYFNYLYTKDLNLDLNKLQNSCLLMNSVIENNFINLQQNYEGKAPITTKLFNNYNLLMYPFEEFHNLYYEIKKMFYEVSNTSFPHYIQCWLNVYNRGEYIDWHGHWPSDCKVWHGFYCVNVENEPSHTLYKIPNVKDVLQIDSINNRLVIGKSEEDLHKSSEWNSQDPRITIAFDIIPEKIAYETGGLNHYIPI